jgi:ABC-type ATPase involved in cell division
MVERGPRAGREDGWEEGTMHDYSQYVSSAASISFHFDRLVKGPPGTGKTTTIAAIARIWDLHDCPVWIIAHSNVAVKNIALALHKREVGFCILVSKEFFEEWCVITVD